MNLEENTSRNKVIQRGTVVHIRNKDMLKQGYKKKERKKKTAYSLPTDSQEYQAISTTPFFLTRNPEGTHPWIVLKRIKTKGPKTKVKITNRSHFEENKNIGNGYKQEKEVHLDLTHINQYSSCTIDDDGVYMDNFPLDQKFDTSFIKEVIGSERNQSCQDPQVDEIAEHLSIQNETYI